VQFYPSQHIQKHPPYWTHIKFNIFSPNMSTCPSIDISYIMCLTQYIMCVWLSFILHTWCYLMYLKPKNKHIIKEEFEYRRSNIAMQLRNKMLHCADSEKVPHMKKFRWHKLLPSHRTNSYFLHIQWHYISKFIQWHSHTNTTTTYHSSAVTFSSPCTLDTHHCTQCIIFQ